MDFVEKAEDLEDDFVVVEESSLAVVWSVAQLVAIVDVAVVEVIMVVLEDMELEVGLVNVLVKVFVGAVFVDVVLLENIAVVLVDFVVRELLLTLSFSVVAMIVTAVLFV